MLNLTNFEELKLASATIKILLLEEIHITKRKGEIQLQSLLDQLSKPMFNRLLLLKKVEIYT